jgi:ferredoxin
VRITTDRDRCIGSGNCAFFAPATFDLDDELKVIIIDGGADGALDAAGDIRAAVEGCPVQALGLIEAEPGTDGSSEGDA